MTNLDIVNEFENYLINKGRDYKTVKSHLSFVRIAVDIIDEPIENWTIRVSTTIEGYLNKKGYAETTYNRMNMSFRIFLSWLIKFKYNTEINLKEFFAEFKAKRIKNKDDVGQKALDYNLFENFLNFVLGFGKGKTSQRARVIVLLEMCAGLRRCETVGLLKSNVNAKDNVLNLVDTKYGKKRNVYVEDFVIDEINKLSELYPDSEYVICTNEGKKVSESQINRSVGTMARKAFEREIIPEKVSPHSLRKSYASYLLFVKKVNQQHIQKLLGHSDPRTTQLYFKTNDDHIKDAVLTLNMRGKEEVIEPVLEELEIEGREDEEGTEIY
jgi:site-specific recombinase XerD